METGTTFREWEAPMNIRKAWDSFDENRKPRYFNYNVYEHMVRECRKPKKEKETKKYYKYDKVGYLAKKLQVQTKDEDQEKPRRVRQERG